MKPSDDGFILSDYCDTGTHIYFLSHQSSYNPDISSVLAVPYKYPFSTNTIPQHYHTMPGNDFYT
ncbi:hypothetical protein BGI40_03840 [Snodgrassella communis]|uniref:Uncharacterized protein n=1 Tax=Snodgrassella communis TaxID=2946699 RepID=A0A836MNH7_9NEIS|nr:hypothetical protein SALWKB29_1812 [Snodgrassella communis]PIT10772.1 hypothetical protein BGI29_01570 [Snodgrassella communis]PIT26986.1 hypothetical protein BGI39_09160 [Snodgrassella communis]PIT27588.1 hypothetical protein BGI38_05585 [Snodgrassella communis]PIT35005.1 hypothetical protein BGI40_03840 [Snodgrassella communis]